MSRDVAFVVQTPYIIDEGPVFLPRFLVELHGGVEREEEGAVRADVCGNATQWGDGRAIDWIDEFSLRWCREEGVILEVEIVGGGVHDYDDDAEYREIGAVILGTKVVVSCRRWTELG